MSKKVDRLQEKMELAKELGMFDWAKVRLESAREIETLTSLTFKPITRRQINKKLKKFYWEWGMNTIPAVIFFVLGICVLRNPIHELNPVGIMATVMGLGFFMVNLHRTDVHAVELYSWSDNIPYGAMLAVKEAKAQGIKKFRIYYPVKQEDKRLISDPIITGHHDNVKEELEVFAWDDGKIYE